MRAWSRLVSIAKYLIFFLVLGLQPLQSFCGTLKVAIIDSFHYQKFVTTEYKKFYIKGIELADQEANKLGINVKYKLFEYHDDDLSIFKSIEKAKKWHPNLIIGPRTSNKFLLLYTNIKHIMTLSPFATSSRLSSLPNNFYSITLPSQYAAKSQYLLIKNLFTGHPISVVTEAPCDSCASESGALLKLLHSNKVKAKNTLILGDQISTSPIDKLLFGKKAIFVLSTMAHTTGVLMARITNKMRGKTIFVGGDGWGTWGDTEAGRLPAKFPYIAYHIVPWSLSNASPYYKHFRGEYLHKYNSSPADKMSFLSYQTLMSAVMAIKNCPSGIKSKGELTAASVLLCYKHAKLQNPNYYRNLNFTVYRISGRKNKIIGTVNPITGLVSISHG